jgi:hypothetical protein
MSARRRSCINFQGGMHSNTIYQFHHFEILYSVWRYGCRRSILGPPIFRRFFRAGEQCCINAGLWFNTRKSHHGASHKGCCAHPATQWAIYLPALPQKIYFPCERKVNFNPSEHWTQTLISPAGSYSELPSHSFLSSFWMPMELRAS